MSREERNQEERNREEQHQERLTGRRATESPASRRISLVAVGVVAPLLTAALVIGPIIVGRADLPDPMATGWDGDGSARSSISPDGFLAIQAALAAVSATLFLVGGLRRFKTPIFNGTAAVIAASIAPTLAVVSVSTVAANRGVADWREVPDPGVGWLIAAITGPLVAIVAIGWLMRATFLTRTGGPAETPSAGLTITASEHAAWHSQASAAWPRLVGVPLVVLGAIISVAGTVVVGQAVLIGGLACNVSGLAALAFSSILVSVDRRGLTVRYGPLPWPRSHVALSDIATASPIQVRPTEHGGWGYRGSRRLFGKAAVVIRAGDGIRLDLNDGREFVVTVDDAAQGAGVLNDLRALVG